MLVERGSYDYWPILWPVVLGAAAYLAYVLVRGTAKWGKAQLGGRRGKQRSSTHGVAWRVCECCGSSDNVTGYILHAAKLHHSYTAEHGALTSVTSYYEQERTLTVHICARCRWQSNLLQRLGLGAGYLAMAGVVIWILTDTNGADKGAKGGLVALGACCVCASVWTWFANPASGAYRLALKSQSADKLRADGYTLFKPDDWGKLGTIRRPPHW